ncbi:hypothetical protein PAHAL_1G254000 [Panicum hallii]|uniref:Uncharacterized protein n=1 Tax=Panicum hallii TaxID=206008 RepID=A0A2S3GPP6_9POAL|nr:hypothetical protein PAHAL_1G254000 [Panicum hallii]
MGMLTAKNRGRKREGNFSHRIRPLLVLCDTLALEVGNGLPDTDCRQRKDPAQAVIASFTCYSYSATPWQRLISHHHAKRV